MLNMDIKAIIKKMSLEDKIALCSGGDFWHTKAFEKYGIPSIMMTDGPHGLRKQNGEADMLGINDSVPATCFPTAVTTACSWDEELLTQMGQAIASEAIANDVALVLGPGICMKRSPLCGRNFEYMSEDPVLAGKLGAGFIRGVEAQGIGSSVKHFALNSQEYKRFNSNSIVDERTLREIYLTAFEIAVKEGKPSTLMSAYNKVNGEHCSEHSHLIKDILRDEWAYNGAVVTDWGGMNDRTQCFSNGADLSMPGGSAYQEKEALEAVKNGQLSEKAIDESASRILELVFRGVETLSKKKECDLEAHHQLARRAAGESAVLLKNEDQILPLKDNQKVGFFGAMAKKMRYQGSGSSHINPTKLSQIYEKKDLIYFAEGCDEQGNTSEAMLLEAEKLAAKVDVAVVCAGLTDSYESEGFDRENINMPEGHVELIRRVSRANKNTVVLLMSGSIVDVSWISEVKGLLFMGLAGQAGGDAARDLLYGDVVPSGKLAETWPMKLEDCVCSSYYGKPNKHAEYREGIYVGYRYYDKAKKAVRFPFGFGLSYTQFDYSELKIKEGRVTVSVENIGETAGAEIVQLYIGNPQDGIHRAVKELKGFKKVFLEPGEKKTVSFELTDRSFAVYQNGWVVPKGTYEILVGSSSVDIRAAEKIDIDGVELKVPVWQKRSFYETMKGIPSRAEWQNMLGKKVDISEEKRGQFTMDNSLSELRKYSMIANKMCQGTEQSIAKSMGVEVDYDNPEYHMAAISALDSPVRVAIMCSGGQFPVKLGEAIVDFANGHKLRGLRKLTQLKKG